MGWVCGGRRDLNTAGQTNAQHLLVALAWRPGQAFFQGIGKCLCVVVANRRRLGQNPIQRIGHAGRQCRVERVGIAGQLVEDCPLKGCGVTVIKG